MPRTTPSTTELASQYIAQVSGDLEANVKEQERISAEIASLQERLAALQHDHGVLVSMQQALGITKATAGTATESKPAVVPSPRRKKAGTAAGGKQKARKAPAAPAKKAATKPTAKKTAAKPAAKKTSTAKAAEPTLVELIRRHLAEQNEPRSAAEISTALGTAHPGRDISAKVVRVTLEGLVAKSQAERSKQGRSVFYSAPAEQATGTPGADAETRSEGTDA
jgi:predicted transcriptional regulator